MSLPNNKIKALAIPTSAEGGGTTTYTIIPEKLQNNGFSADLPTLTADSILVTTNDLTQTSYDSTNLSLVIGNNISDKNVSIEGAQTISGKKTFTSGIQTDEIDNTSGQPLVRYNGRNVFGGINHGCTLMGNEDRPYYSKDGSNFTGNELALLSDIFSNFGVGRWSNIEFYAYHWSPTVTLIDSLSTYYTNIDRYLAGALGMNKITGTSLEITLYLPNFKTSTQISAQNAFSDTSAINVIHISKCKFNGEAVFAHCNATQILCDSDECYLDSVGTLCFANCPNLTTIGAFDVSNILDSGDAYGTGMFMNSTKLKSIHCKHFRVSFNISQSTSFEESDLVEIISNLDEVTTTKTLTMGATNLAKLTDEEKAVATNKGWTLA